MADSKTFRLCIIAPERIFFDEDVEMIELNTTEGEIGILPEHIPLTTIVAPGILRITAGGETKEAALLDGFMEVQKTKVTILAESCEWPDEIDEKRAEAALDRAQERIRNKDPKTDMARAETALLRAMARINVLK